MLQNYLLEATVLLYGSYLLYHRQYITYLILIVMSMIFVLKGINYQESLLFTLVVVLFLTQYHKYFPYREEVQAEPEIQEGFEIKLSRKDKEMKERARKNRRSRKKHEKNMEIHMSKLNSMYPRRYIHNKKLIDRRSETLSDSWRKWARLKENFFIILNK